MRIGPTELIIILVIVILIFGIGKLPELGKSLGQGLHSFKKAQDEITQEVKATTSAIEGKKTEKTTDAVDAEAKKPITPELPSENED